MNHPPLTDADALNLIRQSLDINNGDPTFLLENYAVVVVYRKEVA